MERNEAIEVVRKNYPHVSESDTQFETALRTLVPELAESEDKRIRKWLISQLKIKSDDSNSELDIMIDNAIAWLEKQGEKTQGKSIMKVWKDMRCEVYAQASGNRHEPNCSDNNTKMFSLNDIDEIIEKMSEQNLANSAKTCKDEEDWSEEDEKILNTIINDIQERHPEAMWKINAGNTVAVSTQHIIVWLKSLKEKLVVK